VFSSNCPTNLLLHDDFGQSNVFVGVSMTNWSNPSQSSMEPDVRPSGHLCVEQKQSCAPSDVAALPQGRNFALARHVFSLIIQSGAVPTDTFHSLSQSRKQGRI
jgi:hypothetical protein